MGHEKVQAQLTQEQEVTYRRMLFRAYAQSVGRTGESMQVALRADIEPVAASITDPVLATNVRSALPITVFDAHSEVKDSDEPEVLSITTPSGELTYDPQRRVAFSPFSTHKEPVFLSPLEGKILELFMQHPLRVFSKNQIADVWNDVYPDQAKPPTDKNLTTVIWQLRNKLGGTPKKGPITEVRKRGYTLTPKLSEQQLQEAIFIAKQNIYSEELPDVLIHSLPAGNLILIYERNIAVSPLLPEQFILLYPQEAECLRVLVERPNHVIKYATFLEAMWGEVPISLLSERRNVNQHVGILQKKLGAKHTTRFIHNVRESGFSLSRGF